MNGATTDPWLNIIRPPKITNIKIIGNNQNFFLAIINLKNSFKKSILELIFHIVNVIFFTNPICILL